MKETPKEIINEINDDAVTSFPSQDADMTEMNIIDTTRTISEARLLAKVIIMAENVTQYLVPAINAGVKNVLRGFIDRDELVSAIGRIQLWGHGPL